MPLEGEQLSIKEALALCNVVGFAPNQLDVAVAVMCAESGRYTKAWHANLAADGLTILSTDRGIYQVNDKAHPDFTVEDAFDPKKNAAFTYRLSKQGTDWSPWMAYNSGAHEKFLDAVKEVRTSTEWRTRKKLWD